MTENELEQSSVLMQEINDLGAKKGELQDQLDILK
jgi:hypothetical protein